MSTGKHRLGIVMGWWSPTLHALIAAEAEAEEWSMRIRAVCSSDQHWHEAMAEATRREARMTTVVARRSVYDDLVQGAIPPAPSLPEPEGSPDDA